jgi:hypothetical protein
MAASVLSQGPITLDSSIYPQVCVLKAAEAYREFLSVEVVATEQDTQIISLSILPASVSEAPKIRREFLNHLLDLAVQRHFDGA